FARLHIEGHAVDGLHDSLCPVQQSALESEMLGQILDRQERPGLADGGPTGLSPDVAAGCAYEEGCILRHAHSRTSMAWRRPSLIRLKHMEVMKIMTPGKAATRGDTHSAWRRLLSISPHSALGGVTRRPRKLNPAAKMMQTLIRLVA